MLDGRVKTLHPRVHGGILADRRLRRPPRASCWPPAIAPFELVVVNLYPFAAAARATGHHARRAGRGDRHRRAVDGPRRGQEPRQRRDRHLARRATTRSSRRSTARAGSTTGLRARAGGRGVPPHRRLRRPDRRGAARPDRRRRRRLPDEPGLPAHDPYPPSADRRPREGRDAALRREPAPAGRAVPASGHDARPTGPFAAGEPPLQGKALSYNNVLDASAAAALGRALRGPAVVIVKHTNPCGAAERPTLARGLGGGARGRPGQRVRRRRRADPPGRPAARRGADLDLPRGRRRARRSSPRRSTILATKPNLRVARRSELLAGDEPARVSAPTRWARSGRPAARSS